MNRILLFFSILFSLSCSRPPCISKNKSLFPIPADHFINSYFSLLDGKRIGLLINNTAVINKTCLLDTLMASKINVRKIFAPEHGFRGLEQAGNYIRDSRDSLTHLPIISLYGKKIKPNVDDLKDIDVLVYDIQDVGVRFYTYISTLYYAMEAAAENNIQLIVLDRPNPNGDYIDGPVLNPHFKSFIGIVPVPIVYGLTVGELALMMNGEHWLAGGVKCNLKVIKCKNYTHHSKYELDICPSPNLKTYRALRLYPSLCLFEATKISVGRGTDLPFMVVGGLSPEYGDYVFVPENKNGMQTLNAGLTCYGLDLRADTLNHFSLQYILKFYQTTIKKENFFTNAHWFDLLAGSDKLRRDIVSGLTETQIRAGWKDDLAKFKLLRKKYIIYPD